MQGTPFAAKYIWVIEIVRDETAQGFKNSFRALGVKEILGIRQELGFEDVAETTRMELDTKSGSRVESILQATNRFLEGDKGKASIIFVSHNVTADREAVYAELKARYGNEYEVLLIEDKLPPPTERKGVMKEARDVESVTPEVEAGLKSGKKYIFVLQVYDGVNLAGKPARCR